MADGNTASGILKEDGATSLTLVLPNGVEQVLLRKDVTGVRRLATSLMPSFAEGLTPADVANVLAWLRSNLAPPAEKK
jgi:mono/diheme cytochrome c family protein